MDRRTFLQGASLVPTGALDAMAQQYEGQPAGHLVDGPAHNPRPNVIWILGDQFRAQALASNGDPNARTPNLDRAAVNGVTFTNHLSGFPLCCPFRGSMLTSRYPHHCVPGHEYPLPEGQKTIADVFNASGYRTAYFGKWHLGGFHEREWPRRLLHYRPRAPRRLRKLDRLRKQQQPVGLLGSRRRGRRTPSITAFQDTRRTS